MTLNVRPADGLRQASSPPTERVIAIMEMLGAEPVRQFSLAEISRALHISRATGHAIMTTLADHDWVSRDPRTAKYTWGAAISGLADSPAVPRRTREAGRDNGHPGVSRPS